jgi:hypothetical protein
MIAAQNMVQTLLGTDNSTKGKRVETAQHCQPFTMSRLSIMKKIKMNETKLV